MDVREVDVDLIDMNRINALGAHLEAAAAETGIDFAGVQMLRLVAPVVAIVTHHDRMAMSRPLELQPRVLRRLLDGPPSVKPRRRRRAN